MTLKTSVFDFYIFQNRGDGLDMNVEKAWEQGVTGRGVVVTILDDGIETDHPDLQSNYVSIFTSLFLFLLLEFAG